MEIILKIKQDSGKEIELTGKECEELYKQLDKIYGPKNVYSPVIWPNYMDRRWLNPYDPVITSSGTTTVKAEQLT